MKAGLGCSIQEVKSRQGSGGIVQYYRITTAVMWVVVVWVGGDELHVGHIGNFVHHPPMPALTAAYPAVLQYSHPTLEYHLSCRTAYLPCSTAHLPCRTAE